MGKIFLDITNFLIDS